MHGPPECPRCGHDPRGDDDEFVSGGGWLVDNEVFDRIYAQILRCPVCENQVARNEQRKSGGRR